MSPATPAQPITLLHLTDPHLFAAPEGALLGIDTRQSLRAVLRHIAASGIRPDRVLATGDLAQDAEPGAYTCFLDMVALLKAPVHALPGNHDVPARLRAALGAAADPVVDCGAWRLILLDSSQTDSESGHLADDQLDLLREAGRIEAHRHLLVALHHNPIPMGSAWLDTMQVDNAPALFDALAGLPRARALVWGHVHQAHDSQRPGAQGESGLRLMATPATCFQFLPHSAHFSLDTALPGYRWIRLHANGQLDTEIVRIPALPPEAGQPDTRSPGY
ncbi:3',5'-cyclic-AMP phosphodiesterase [Castellaniella ginsengisoli]|uniref:3',5'-cyclic-AMP phosphodiesterase n=1 Tax=Castellaniella ginsengisoli TaxID=546114 RepID=A0AB39D9B8_9BURK